MKLREEIARRLLNYFDYSSRNFDEVNPIEQSEYYSVASDLIVLLKSCLFPGNMRIIKVSQCYSCPYRKKFFLKHYCKKTNKKIPNIYDIPDWCPLPRGETLCQ